MSFLLQDQRLTPSRLTLSGRDRLSNTYIDQLNDMAGDMMFKTKKADSMKDSDTDMYKSMSLALWSLYMQSV